MNRILQGALPFLVVLLLCLPAFARDTDGGGNPDSFETYFGDNPNDPTDDLNWLPAETLGPANTFLECSIELANSTLDLAEDNLNQVHVVWESGDTIYYRKYGLSGWSPLETLGSGQCNGYLQTCFPRIAVDPNNGVHVAWSDAVTCAAHVMFKQNDTWIPRPALTACITDLIADAQGREHLVTGSTYYRYSGSSWQSRALTDCHCGSNCSDNINTPKLLMDGSGKIHVAELKCTFSSVDPIASGWSNQEDMAPDFVCCFTKSLIGPVFFDKASNDVRVAGFTVMEGLFPTVYESLYSYRKPPWTPLSSYPSAYPSDECWDFHFNGYNASYGYLRNELWLKTLDGHYGERPAPITSTTPLRVFQSQTRSAYWFTKVSGSLVLYRLDRPDRDGDGLLGKAEQFYGTDEDNPDTDGDKMTDGWEVSHLSCVNPLVNDASADPDGDAIPNLLEYQLGGDPCFPSQCNDGLDNDGDTLTDLADPDCLTIATSYERNCTPGSTCCDGSGHWLAAGTSCNDSNACTSGETCNASHQCTGGATQCTPGSTCCNGSGCWLAAGISCSDGNACTNGETCNASHLCLGGTLQCTPGSTCCDGSGCWLATDTSCNDGNACTSGDACNASHQCTGVPQCTPGSTCCDGSGCWLATDTSCNDHNVCTSGETCNASHQCTDGVFQCLPGSTCCDGSGCYQPAGTACPGGECDSQGDCVCTPNCSGKECGDDGCGGSCGSCSKSQTCQAGQCVGSGGGGGGGGSNGCGGCTIAPEDLTPEARAFNALVYLIPLLGWAAVRIWRQRRNAWSPARATIR